MQELCERPLSDKNYYEPEKLHLSIPDLLYGMNCNLSAKLKLYGLDSSLIDNLPDDSYSTQAMYLYNPLHGIVNIEHLCAHRSIRNRLYYDRKMRRSNL